MVLKINSLSKKEKFCVKMFKACQEIYLGSTSGEQNSVFGRYQQTPDDGMFISGFSICWKMNLENS